MFICFFTKWEVLGVPQKSCDNSLAQSSNPDPQFETRGEFETWKVKFEHAVEVSDSTCLFFMSGSQVSNWPNEFRSQVSNSVEFHTRRASFGSTFQSRPVPLSVGVHARMYGMLPCVTMRAYFDKATCTKDVQVTCAKDVLHDPFNDIMRCTRVYYDATVTILQPYCTIMSRAVMYCLVQSCTVL